MDAFHYTLPAVRGVQAGREYFVAMCPLYLVPRLFPLEGSHLRPELQLQRILNKNRIPEMVRYLTGHPKSYILSSLTASVNAQVQFEPFAAPTTIHAALGHLQIPLAAQLLLHDGLHRRAAIEIAVKNCPAIANETVSLVLFVDPGLRRAEQMFTDLKRNETHSARSRSILFDHRDETAKLVKAMIARVPVFADLTETARSTISNRSLKLFTLSAIYHATAMLLADNQEESFTVRLALATAFWTEVAKHIPDWRRAKEGKISPAELRKNFVHAHAIALAALARMGRALLLSYASTWPTRLRALRGLDWSRSNTHLWEGRAMIGGRISKASMCVVLTGNALKQRVGQPLLPDEQAAEQFLQRRS
jgi:DNA sulfur modification protein DndB